MAILFFISIFLVLHSYALYPLLLWLLALNRKPSFRSYNINDELPFLSIIMAAHNEEKVIEKKIESIFCTSYPLERFEVIIGSDCSTDDTVSIIQSTALVHKNLSLIEYTQRQGKVSVMNQLVERARGEIIISTDANVMLNTNTLFELVKFFNDRSVGLVDTRMINTGLNSEGISIQESTYINQEFLTKHREGLLWGTMVGPFGGCYAIRKILYQEPPANYLVDDFFISMKVIEQGKKCINSIDAIVYEDVSNLLSEEFRRKVRIAMGSFQNLKHFRRLLWPPYKPIAFAFLSHKVLRWFGPILIILALASCLALSFSSKLFAFILLAQLIMLSLPLADLILRIFNIHFQLFRFITHFLSMNLALLVGLIKYFKGVNSNVWQPTQRNQ